MLRVETKKIFRSNLNGLDGDVGEVSEASLVDHLHLEVGHVDHQAFLDLTDAVLQDLVSLLGCHIWNNCDNIR